MRVIDPDTYLTELLGDLPDEVIATIVRVAAEKTRPPRTTHDILDALRRAGLRAFADRVEQRL